MCMSFRQDREMSQRGVYTSTTNENHAVRCGIDFISLPEMPPFVNRINTGKKYDYWSPSIYIYIYIYIYLFIFAASNWNGVKGISNTQALIVIWWRHHMETLFVLRVLGSLPASGRLPSQMVSNSGFDVFFDISLNNEQLPVLWVAITFIVMSK